MNTVSKQLFFELLREARQGKARGWELMQRRFYLLGMMRSFLNHYEEIKAGQNIQDCWKAQNSGAEGV